MLVAGQFPYDLNNLAGGAVRALIAPYTPATVPDVPSKGFAQVSPYGAKAPFFDLGATKEAFQYARGIEVGGYQIQQVQGNVIEEITNVTRTARVSMAEIGPQGLSLIEQHPAIDDVAAVAGSSAYKKLAFGSISDLQRYHVIFYARRSLASGVVQEGAAAGARKRGRLLVGIGYNCAISADNVDLGFSKGDLAAAQVTFKFFPEPSLPQGEEYGGWFDEAAGIIA